MELEEASKIVNIWGIHLEHFFGKLIFVFGGKIPESFLPFPAEMIEEAVNVIAEQHHRSGNKEAVKALQSTLGYLVGYVDDREAIERAAEFFIDPRWQEKTLPAFKRAQQEWMSQLSR